MADPRGGLGSIARNGNSAARTYGAGPRRRTGDAGPARPLVTDGMRPRTVTKVAGGGALGAASTASAAADAASAAGGGPDAAGDGDTAGDPDPEPALAPRATHISLCAVRRTLLAGLAAGAAALVAGCGDDSAADAPAPAAQGGRSGSPSGSPTTEPSLEPFPGAEDGGGNDTGLVKTADIPVGGAVLVQTYLIAQPQRGVFKAFDATCPHQGITVDPPLGGNNYFMCPGHNSKFRLADGGLISGPAPRGLKQVPVKVRNGYVVEA